MGSALNRTNVAALIVILGLMLAIGLPYLLQSREEERRTMCEFRMGQIARSILEYEDSHTEFPGYRDVPSDDIDESNVASWAGLVLPYLSGAPFQPHVKANGLPNGAELATPKHAAAEFIPAFVCPDDTGKTDFNSNHNLSYVANCGMPDAMAMASSPSDWRANGVFMDHMSTSKEPQRVSLSYVEEHDGAAETLLLSENVDAGLWTDSTEPRVGFVWTTNGLVSQPVPTDRVLPINQQIGKGDSSIAFARPSSFHDGGVNAAFCDEHVEFLSADIDYLVFARLMATNDSAAKYPGTNTPIGPPFRTTVAKDTIMRHTFTAHGDHLR